MKSHEIKWLFIRYIFLVLIALPGMQLFYIIFTPLTVYPAFWLLSLFYDGIYIHEAGFILPDQAFIVIAPACIAGAAYYLLLILNFSTPMPLKIRIKSIAFLIISFLAFNIIRLFVFSALFLNNYPYFGIAHKATWYFGSTLLVVILWFANIKMFKINAIPAYTDIKDLFKRSRSSRQ